MKYSFMALLVYLLLAGGALGFYVEPRIIGGEDVDYESDEHVPHYVVTVFPDEFLCGGSYIGEGLIITAAHCLFYADEDGGGAIDKDDIKVQFSEYGQLNDEDAVVIDVVAVHIHEEYDDPQFNNA